MVAIEDKIVNKQNIIPAFIELYSLLGETGINEIHHPVVGCKNGPSSECKLVPWLWKQYGSFSKN